MVVSRPRQYGCGPSGDSHATSQDRGISMPLRSWWSRVLCQAPVLTLALPPEWSPLGFD